MRIRSWNDLQVNAPRTRNGYFWIDEVLGDIYQSNPTKKWKQWDKLWENLGVAHVAAVYLKEVHYNAESNEITNKAAIIKAL